MQLRPRSGSVESCVYCWDLVSDAATHTCPGCLAQYHTDCLAELDGRCATIGCPHAAVAPDAQAPTCVQCAGRFTGSDQRTCPGCRATYHRRCLLGALRGRCATPGCPKVLRARSAAEAAPPEQRCRACDGGIGHARCVMCPGCDAIYHRACLLDRLEGRCETPGCTKVLRLNPGFRLSYHLPELRLLLTALALAAGVYGVANSDPRAAIAMALIGGVHLLTHVFDRPSGR